MKRKTYMILALALVLAMVLTGCGEKPQGGTVAAPTEVKSLATEAPETEAPETEAPETEAPETTEPAGNPLSLGRMEGGTYTNTYAGFGFDLDESWMFYSAEELQEMPAALQEAMEGSQIEEMMDGIEQFMDVKADNESAMTSINVLYSKMDMATRLTYQLLTEEEIIDATLSQQDMMIEAYEQAGITGAQIEKVKVNFLGEEHFGMKTHAQIQGVDYYVLQVINYHAGSYGITVSCASFVEDNTQAVLDLFYPVSE